MTRHVACIALIVSGCTASRSGHDSRLAVTASDAPHEQPTPQPEPVAALQPELACAGPCLGYSPSKDVWVCGLEQSGSGMVAWHGRRCSLQLLRGDNVLAEVAVLAERSDGARSLDETLSFEHALRLLPDDLVTATSIGLELGFEIAIPGSPHRLRWNRGNHDRAVSTISLLCNPRRASRPQTVRTFGHSSGRPRRGGTPPAPMVVFVGPSVCDLREHYRVEVAPGGEQIALIEDSHWGCIDYSLGFQRAHPIDLARACAGE